MPDAFGQMSYGYFMLLLRELEAADVRDHYPACMIQATLANLQRDPDKVPEQWTPWDFMYMAGFRLKEDREKRIATPEELSAFFGAVKRG